MLLATVDVPGAGRWKERVKHWHLLCCDVCSKSFLRKSSRRTNKDLCSTQCKAISHRKTNLKRRVNVESVKARLFAVHGFNVVLDESTYVGTTKKARFLDFEHGVWWAQVKSVIQGRRHSDNRYGKRLLSRSEIDQRLNQVHGSHVSIVSGETYVNSHQKIRFIDDEFGEWEAMPYSVFAGHGHPRRGFQNAMRKMRATGRFHSSHLVRKRIMLIFLSKTVRMLTRTWKSRVTGCKMFRF